MVRAIPSPPVGVWHLGPLPIRAYALAIIVGIIVASWLGSRRIRQRGGPDEAMFDIALWAVPFGIVGGRLYHVISSPQAYFGPDGEPWKALAIWEGGLGIWGSIALGALGAYIGARRAGLRFPPVADALAPGIVIAQGIGRLGNWFNQELFGSPTDLPWALEVSPAVAVGAGYPVGTTFHPAFLYELVWDFAIAAGLILIDRRRRIGHGRVFCLYVFGYTVGRLGIELLRVDPANHILGLRLNVWTSIIVGLAALSAFIVIGRRHPGRDSQIRRVGAEPDPAQEGQIVTTPFTSLDDYVALPRVNHLALSGDGQRIVVVVQTPDADGTKFVTALWEVDPAGLVPARRLTRSAKGEGAPVFTADGDLLFVSARPRPDAAKGSDDEAAALWLLPAGGGEARPVTSRKAGIDGVIAARQAPVVVATSNVLPHAADLADDDRLVGVRIQASVGAILHSGYPVRFWDHDLGPGRPHYLAARLDAAPPDSWGPDGLEPAPLAWRDITADAAGALIEQSGELTPDGATVVTAWEVPERSETRPVIVAIDVATGQRRVLIDDPEADLEGPRVSPDGSQIAYVRETHSTPHQAVARQLWVADIDGQSARRIVADWDRWPNEIVWLPDGDGLLVVADDGGRAPVFHIDLASQTVTQVTSDDAAFSDIAVTPDGVTIYGLRASWTAPAEPVRIDLGAALKAGRPVEAVTLLSPVSVPPLPGRLAEVSCQADGAEVRSWLVLPSGAGPDNPAPLLLWIHGGPLASWNAWSWRWCPWIMAARGYAVLLPDPALSTGYGQDFIERGWGAWGKAPYEDLMAITDAAIERDDIDASRTAAMGGSFGGYMSNWVAGHTDRFKAIVTHASLWALDQFGPTTDLAYYWKREMDAEMAQANSPHRSVGQIVTPMLMIHGDRDYRVPIGEGLRLWFDLLDHSGLPADADGRSPHRFLYFPNENHWVLTPQHAKIWYEVVDRFLAEHVLGQDAEALPPLPETLG